MNLTSIYRQIQLRAALPLLLLVLGSTHSKSQLPAVSFNHLVRDKELFSSFYITVAEDQYGFIWFGSMDGGGLYRYDGYQLISFLPDPARLETSLATMRVTEVNTEMDSAIYVGTSFGMTILNPISGEMKSFHNSMENMPDIRLGLKWTFLYDTIRDVVWEGTRYGLLQFNPADTGAFNILRPDLPVDGKYMPEEVTKVIIDRSHHNLFWLATSSGLFNYDITSRNYTHFEYEELKGQPVSISDLYQEPSGTLWMATREGNLIRFDMRSAQWQLFPIPASDTIFQSRKDVYSILPDDNAFWLATHTGVGKFDIQSGRFESWHHQADHPDGLLKNGVFRDLISDRHGRLWIASWQGIQSSRQAFLAPSQKATKLKAAITGATASPMYEDDIEQLIYTTPLSLHKDQRDVTIQYVLPNPFDPDEVTYQYKLDGYDKDWITTDQRTVRYPRLGGGHYVFMVRAKEGPKGEWLPATELQISIEKRLTEFWWFWTFMAAILLLSAFMLYRFMISRARKQERLKSEFEHKLSEVQMQALRAQMNPHFLFNSLNSIKYYAISKSKDETAAYLSKFALLVRTILNNSKSHTISLKDELDALQLYIEIEHLRLEGKFDYLIDIDKGIHIHQAQIPPMILQPYVENAIWHGLMHKESKGLLLVQVKDLGSQIQCIIEDNGVGRKRAEEIGKSRLGKKSSVGMEITGNRIEIINRIYGIDTQVQVIDLKDAENKPTGTRVVINIPLIRDEEE